MTHPLDGARLKIIWAQKHLDALNVEVADYVKGDPYAITVGNDPQYFDSTANITHHPKDTLGAIIGDCLQNLNSALDYVMWEIAGTFAGRELLPSPIGNDTPHFPIFYDPANFEGYIARLNNSKNWNYKIPDTVIQAFRDVQPYNTGYERLWIFKQVVNTDKHRLPLITQGDINAFQITVSKITVSPQLNPHLTDDPSYYTPQVKAEAAVHVTWQDPFMPREPVTRTIEDFVKLVADIVPRFDNFVI